MSKKMVKSKKFDTFGMRNMRVLKITCPECGAKAVIRKTNRMHPEIADIYCSCADVECGHTFVMNLTFSHTISPSAKTGDILLQTVINNLNPQQRQMALDLLQTSAA
ncbi:ogr/Delta-like zinc finger family protein [Xenorhabdus sp. Vera]|uniref:ogr/Delta-like zinc finger family protein n=1 Tax=Xenorhabdus koppenhoeferi TaxID=351659 RepID=UPI0019C45E26|nr:ogr/Delta-like zinc finger family protein [Xenorhabdus sp. Vera]MBD2811393.1 ogr/Delta-like zinc finger family protein [Xenorhabdus sp. Vera]